MATNGQQIIQWLNQQQLDEAVRENPKLVDQTEVKAIIQQSLTQLSSIEHQLDRLENQDVVKRIIGSMTGSTNRERITLMRYLTRAQQTTIKLVLTLAAYHASNIAVMDEILEELDKTKSVHKHARTMPHIEFLYEQVQMIRDAPRTRKKAVARRWGMGITIIASIAVIVLIFVK